jgi:hypothetical protein
MHRFVFVQAQAFIIHIISRKIQHLIVTLVEDRSTVTMLKHLDYAVKLYASRGFEVTDIHADGELECIWNNLLPINLNTVESYSHVGEIERSIQTIKERNRSTVHGLPYKRIPCIMVKSIVKHSVTCLNQLPADNGISTTMSPHTIMTGKRNPEYNDLKIELGTYVQVYETRTFSSNTLKSRTTGAITLTYTSNTQGS